MRSQARALSAAIEQGLSGGWFGKDHPLRVAVAALLAATAPQVQADVFTVTSTGDPGASGLSLRQAVAAASLKPGSTINFAPALVGSMITLTQGQIEIDQPMSIVGSGVAKLMITTSKTNSRIFYLNGEFTTPPVTIDGLTLNSGTNPADGSVLYDTDTSLVLQNSVISSGPGGYNVLHINSVSYDPYVHLKNVYIGKSTLTGENWIIALTAQQGFGGSLTTEISNCTIANNSGAGAIYASGSTNYLSIYHSRISSNTGGSYGGAVFANGISKLNIGYSTFDGNSVLTDGGALFVAGSPFTIYSSVVNGNTSGRDGGALFLNDVYTGIQDSVISGNTAGGNGGGVLVAGSTTPVGNLALNRTSVTGNQAYDFGAGIDVRRTSGVYIYYSLINDNSLTDFTSGANGGGLALQFVSGPSRITDSTVYHNFAYHSGGGIGIFDAGTGNRTAINASTIARNSTFNAYSNGMVGAGQPTITSSIVANNANAYSQTQDLVGSFTVNYSLIKNPVAATLTGSHNITNGTDPQLGPLAMNGGTTLSMLPAAGSPVLDHGSAAGPVTTDQRGAPRSVGAAPDMGSVERQNPEVIIFRAGFDSP